MSRWKSRRNLQQLRAAVAQIGRRAAAPEGRVLPLDLVPLDRALGEGGLRLGVLHEVSGTAADGFAAVVAGRLASRSGGAVLWCVLARRGVELYPPGLAALGLDPARLLQVRCRDRAALLAAAEEGLRGGGPAAVVVEGDRVPDMVAGRRLQLAAEDGGVTGLLLVRHGSRRRHGARGRRGAVAPEGPAPDTLPPSVAVSRWRADHACAGAGATLRWRLALLRCRAGGTGEWEVDWNAKTLRLALVSPAGD